MADVDSILLEMERRGHDFFDDTMRIGRVMDLLNRSRVQQGFEQQVVADAPQQIERKVGELVDWLVDADLRQWQAVTRASGGAPPPVSRIGSSATRRGAVPLRPHAHDRLGRPRSAARSSIPTTASSEAQELADGARNAVAAAAAVGAGALGLGAIVTHRRDHRRRRRHRHRPGVGARGDRVLHPAGQAQAREGRDAARRSPRCAPGCRRRCASSSRRKSSAAASGSARASPPTAGSSAPKGTS